MKKHKSPSELSTRLLRANLDTYLMVKGLSRQLNIPMADALDKLITGQPKPKPMPVTAARSMPVTAARSMPVIVAMSTPVTAARSMPVIAAKSTPVTVIKPKGGILND
ncbi:unnamed protein product [marine sediment metagenome]|uniref:Uncharacterized protein n=1 Tax=marine sediment metagenome TaxID=412755 RepID=X1RTN4_9ZZZZ